jgi:hypothetical protein
MIEILATIIVVALCAVAAVVVFGAVLWFVMEILEAIRQVVIAPWTIYRWWQKRGAAREELLVQRTAEIQKEFIREAGIQNGPQTW